MRIRNRQLPVLLSLFLALCFATAARADDIEPLLAKIKAVGKRGDGNVEAARAWKKLSKHSSGVLTDILAAMDDANPVALNYLRSAFETIADRTLSQGKPLPTAKLEAFVKDTQYNGKARRLAYEWLVRIDGTAPDRLLPSMVNDPGAALRRDAVARLIDKAKKFDAKKQAKKARQAYQLALKYARDRDQVQEVAGQLKKLGVEVDLTKHFGFITQWMVVAPFDNHKEVGFARSYPPEEKVNLAVAYAGKDGKKISWKKIDTDKNMGMVDFNQIFGDWHGVVAYACTVVNSPKTRPVEIRASSNDAVKIYLNGKEIYSREEYHHGTRMDQHTGKGMLRKGRNTILIKVCQNEQTETWAQEWSFNLRVTDHLGAPVPIKVEVK